MSRVGFKVIEVPKEVNLDIGANKLIISGPKGKLDINLADNIRCEYADNILKVVRLNDERETKAIHGTSRAMINNAIIGVTNGFQKKLEIHGIGYKASMQGEDLYLNIGFSHQVIIKPRKNSKIICQNATNIVVEGIDKQAVGQTAALIHATKSPEPYKGKGIRYVGERILHKEGKKATTSTSASSASGAKGKK